MATDSQTFLSISKHDREYLTASIRVSHGQTAFENTFEQYRRYPVLARNFRTDTFGYCDVLDNDTFGYLDGLMSKVQMGISREAHTEYDPEDVRVGQTLQALMYRTEETPEGYLIRRRIRHDELAKGIRLPSKPNGVHRTYISQLCQGAKHMNNEMLYAIAKYLGVHPVAIKRPDQEHATNYAA